MAETVLSAEEHFEGLREAVWRRYAARHRGTDRDRFEDLYAEWWAREVERAAKGTPSRAAAPVAYVAEAVHRVLLDDVRARARGLGRDDKGSLDIVDLAEQLEAAGADDTAEAAEYEALAHRILTLVRGSLSEREVRVFVWSYLYLQPAEQTARALGLSLPRVKKDRKKIAGRIGAQVWAVLDSELDLCEAYREHSLPAIFEVLTVHVEDCEVCAAALGKVRRGALVVCGPELLLLGGATEGATHVFTDLVHGFVARVQGLVNRGTETLVALPPNGRTAAAVAFAATAVAGGAATVVPEVRHSREPPERRSVAEVRKERPAPTATATAAAAVVVSPVPTTPPVVTARPNETPRAKERERRRARAAAGAEGAATRAPAATSAPAVQQDEISFEEQAPEPAPTSAPATSSAESEPAPRPATSTREFGFEQP